MRSEEPEPSLLCIIYAISNRGWQRVPIIHFIISRAVSRKPAKKTKLRVKTYA